MTTIKITRTDEFWKIDDSFGFIRVTEFKDNSEHSKSERYEIWIEFSEVGKYVPVKSTVTFTDILNAIRADLKEFEYVELPTQERVAYELMMLVIFGLVKVVELKNES